MNKLILAGLLVVVFISPIIYAENSKGYLSIRVDPYPSNDYSAYLPLLDEPNGTKEGHILLSVSTAWEGLESPSFNTTPTRIDKRDTWSIHNTTKTIKFYEVEDGHARVLAKTVDKGVWVNLNHSPQTGNATVQLTPEEWSPLLYGTLWRISGYHNYRLRKAPSKSAEVLVYLSENRHIIKHGTGNIDGHWAEVVVLESTYVPHNKCYDSIDEIKEHLTGRQWVGWIKVLGDNGEPNDITGDGIC
jgi:hypothetical protein